MNPGTRRGITGCAYAWSACKWSFVSRLRTCVYRDISLVCACRGFCCDSFCPHINYI